MKCLRFVLVLVSLGLILCCTPTANQSNSDGARAENATDVELPSTTVVADTPPVTLTPNHAPNFTPTTLPASTATESPNPTITPTNTAVSRPTAPTIPLDSPAAEPAVSPTAVATPAAFTVSADTAEQVKYGLEVYKQLYCGLCHQLDAAGTAGKFGPSHNGMATIAIQRVQESQYTGKATTATEYIHESIVDPKAFAVPGYEHTQHQMPIYNFLSESDVVALVQMLLQQK